MKLPELGVQKPVTTLMFFLAIFVLGVVMATQLSVDYLPEIERPTVTVVTTWEGVSAEDVESMVTKVVERSLGTVNGLEEMTSATVEGISSVTCEFAWGTNLDEASNDIRSNLERIRQVLPDDADPPMLRKFNTSQIPIQFYGVTCNESLEALEEIVNNEVADPLKRLPGVGAVTLFGGLERQINIQLDPARLAGYGLQFDLVAAALAKENVTLPAGNIKVGQLDYTIRVPGEFTAPEQIGEIVIRSSGGALVRLRDVAEVADGFAEETRLSNVMGRRAIMMMIQKRSGANTVAAAREVARELENNILPTLPRDIEIHQIFDTSETITQSIGNVAMTIRWAFVFVVLTAFFFLRNVRSALIIALTIPFSLILAIIFMWTMGWTINIISLASLAIAMGMVVDNAVVVLENITTKVDAGMAPREAAMFGSEEVGTAISASTLTTIVVFVPLIFLKGEAGIMFKQLGGLLVATLTASLVCALWLTPMLGSRLLRAPAKRKARRRITEAFHVWSEARFEALDAAYSRLLERALRRRWLVVAAAVLIFGSSVVLFMGLGSEYAPEDDNGRLMLRYQTPIGTRVEETAALGQRILDVALEEIGRENIKVYAWRCGQSGGWGQGGSHMGHVMLRLVPQTQRKRGLKEIGRAVADVVAQWPETQKISVDTSQMGPGGGGKPIIIEVLGFDLDILQGVAEQVLEVVNTTPGAVDSEIGRDPGRPEIRVEIDRIKAAAHGLNVAQVANSVRTLFYGTTATMYRESDEDYDIVLRLDEPYRRTIADIAQSEIALPSGGQIRLDSVANIEERLGALQIDRRNQERMIQVTADVFGRSSGEVVRDLRQRLAEEVPLPSGIGIHFGGTAEDQEESFRQMALMMVLGILLVYMVMASQFESLLDPFLILFSIPFAFTGVAISLTLLRLTVSIMSFIGMILLVGVVVNNAIVLIDYINLLRARGQKLAEAIVHAGRSRLRPVLITTMTTTLAMIPMILSRGEGSATWKPMAATIVGGLTFSMLVTLVLVPTLYSLAHSRVARKRELAAAEKGVRV
ncbi:MAG: efflux RND transporter permease subunit [Kiritimatiellia bacterium]|jgi:HAE1 family hydrophobic/amphiphilic exporter-1|nr:efflux RND transporter permease subunit [Kiritimatiellia bacterium]